MKRPIKIFKPLSCLLLVAGLLSYLAGSTNIALAASNNGFTLSTSSLAVQQGSEFNVTVLTHTTTAISGVGADTVYDSSKLTFVSYSESGTAFPVFWDQTPDTNKISTTRSAISGVVGSKIIETYRFKALVAGQTTIEVTGKANAGGAPLTLSKASVTINIISSASPPAGGTATTQPTTGTSAGVGSNTANMAAPTTTTDSSSGASSQSEATDNAAGPGPSTSGSLVALSKNVPFIGNASPKSQRLFLAGASFVVLSLLAGGTWYLVRWRKATKAAKAHVFEPPDNFFMNSALTTSSTQPMATAVQPQENMPDVKNVPSMSPAMQAFPNSVVESVVITPTQSQSVPPDTMVPSRPAPTINHNFAPSNPQIIAPSQTVVAPTPVNEIPPSKPTLIQPDESAN